MTRQVPALLARLERWSAKHRPEFVRGLLPGASPADLDALQAGLTVPVPEELRELLAWHNGQSDVFTGAFVESRYLMSSARILAAKQELDAGAAAGGPATAWQPTWIAFLEDDADNYLCLDTSQPEAPVREVWHGKAEAPLAAASLKAWLLRFVTEVERGDYHEDPERGRFLHGG